MDKGRFAAFGARCGCHVVGAAVVLEGHVVVGTGVWVEFSVLRAEHGLLGGAQGHGGGVGLVVAEDGLHGGPAAVEGRWRLRGVGVFCPELQGADGAVRGAVAARDLREDEVALLADQAEVAGSGATAFAGVGVLDAARPVDDARLASDGGGVDAAAVVELSGVPAWVAFFGEHSNVGEFKLGHCGSPVVGLLARWSVVACGGLQDFASVLCVGRKRFPGAFCGRWGTWAPLVNSGRVRPSAAAELVLQSVSRYCDHRGTAVGQWCGSGVSASCSMMACISGAVSRSPTRTAEW